MLNFCFIRMYIPIVSNTISFLNCHLLKEGEKSKSYILVGVEFEPATYKLRALQSIRLFYPAISKLYL